LQSRPNGSSCQSAASKDQTGAEASQCRGSELLLGLRQVDGQSFVASVSASRIGLRKGNWKWWK
jgi:hypothetical protein